jgi:Tfp pilus assembly protein PilF
VPNRARWLPVGGVLWLLAAGCSQMTAQTSASDAEKQWNEVRARVKLQLAEQQLRAGAIEEAVRTASEAVLLEPSLPGGYVVLSRAYLERGEPSKAERVLENAAAHDVRSATLCYTHGVLLEQQGRNEEAYGHYAEAVELDPDESDYLIAKAECLVAMGRFDDARTLVRERMASGTADQSLNMLAGHLASRAGDDAEAVAVYGRALVALPESTAIREAYGLALLRTGRTHEGISMLRPACEDMKRPASGSVVRAYARGCLATGQSAAALGVLARHVREAPSDLPARMLLAEAAISNGDFMTALQSIDAVSRQVPDDPDVALMRATVQIKRGDREGAIDSLSLVTRLRPEDAVGYCMLASVLEASGDLDAARERYTRALEIQPGSRMALAGLERLSPPEAAVEPAPAESPDTPALGTELTRASP